MKKLLLIVLIGAMLFLEGFFFIVPANSAPAVSSTTTTASQPLIPFTGSVVSVSKPPPVGKIGQDLGTNQIRFKQNAIQFFRSSGNITIGFPSFGSSLTTQALKNTSQVAYHFTGTFAGHSVDVFVYFKNSSNGYNRKVIITGTISGLVGTLSLNMPLSGLSSAVCDSAAHIGRSPNGTLITIPPCTTQCFGSMCFDWTDSKSSTSYNNVTKTVTFTVGASFFFDPLALDGSAKNQSNSASSLGITLSTTSTNDIVIVTMNIFNEAGHAFTGISDTSSLTWTLRKLSTSGGAGGTNIRVYYAIASSALTNDVITVTTASNTFISLIGFGVSGANTGTPFDSNAGLPSTNTGTGGTLQTVTFSTSNANDFIYILGADANAGGSFTVDAGYTKIQDITTACCVDLADEYKVVSTTQTNFVSSFNDGGSNLWVAQADAIQQASLAVTKQQTKNCTFTSLSSPTCTFASNVPINDVSVVGVETSINTNTITSVTDSASNTYTLVTAFAVLSAVGLNAVYCSNVGTAGTLVVTVNFGAASTGVIVLYDLANAAASCAGTGSDDSVGSRALSSSPSVGSYTPSQTGFEIGFLNSGCNVACTVSAGGGYAKDNDVAITAALKATSESIANSATATTTPFSLSASSAWSEISVTFVIAAETTVTLPLTCTMSNSAPQQTLTLDGASASPATLLCDASSHNITVDKSSTLTMLIPIDATNTRSRFKQGSSATAALTWSVATCSSGTCAGASNTTYYQQRNLYQATPVGPTVWDMGRSIAVKGNFLGVASSTCGTIITTGGSGAASNQIWCENGQGLLVTMDDPVGPWSAIPAGTNTFNQNTGGNTDNVNYAISGSTPVTVPNAFPILGLFVLVVFFLFLAATKRRR